MTVGIYGLGRFGSFWASQLATVCEVKGYNRTPRGQAPAGVSLVSRSEVLSCDTVILCVAISAFRQVVASIAGELKPATVLMDTCSVKSYPASVMLELVGTDVQLIATHPMFGPDSGKDGIEDLPIVFSPLRCSQESVDTWRSIFQSLHLRVLEMDCDQHDRQVAYSQGVTHFVGRVLSELHLGPTELATVGYKQLLAIVEQTCNDSLQLFYDLQHYNPYARAMQENLREAVERVFAFLNGQEPHSGA